MHNWSVDEQKLKKDKTKYLIWRLEQMINFGLSGKKIKKSDLKKYWKKINIDQNRRKFLRLILSVK